MFTKKKISAFLACFMAVSLLMTGCGKTEETDDDLVPNVITSGSDSGSAEGTDATPAETVIVTDDDGNAVTGVGGNVITEPAVTTQIPQETLSDEDIEALLNPTTTQATTVVTASVDSTTRYAYNTLTDDEKMLYDAILGAASTLNFRIRGTENLTLEQWTKILGMVYNQEPQLFWLNSKVKIGRLYFNETDTAKIAEMQKAIDVTVEKILADAANESTTFGKLKVFHDYLVYNSTFELSDEITTYNESIYNAFGYGSGVQGNIQCGGYAKAMQYLCDRAGIECMVITGENATGSTHAWNKVKVDGEWYNIDATWDDPILSVPETDYIRYNYFLVPDSWINEKTHFSVNTKTLSSGASFSYYTAPAATATAQNYFIKNGLVYSDLDSAEAALKKALDDAASSGLTVAEIMVDSQDVYNTMTSRLKEYQTYVKDKYSNVKGLSNNCNEHMLVIELDVKYN